MIHHIKRATRHLIFWSLLVVAISLTGIRLVLSGIDSYKINLAERISAELGAPVTIDKIGAKMRGFSPELILTNIKVQAANAQAPAPINLKEIRLGTNLFALVSKGELWTSAWLTLIGTKLTVLRKPDGSIAIAGLTAGGETPSWLLQCAKIAILDSEIRWQNEITQAKPLQFNADLVLNNDGERHRLNVLAQLPKSYGSSLRLSVDLTGNILNSSSLQGRMYISASQLQLAQFSNLVLTSGVRMPSGQTDIEVWTDWQQGRISQATVSAHLQQAKIGRYENNSLQINRLDTLLHGKRQGNSWQVLVDKFALATASKTWPDIQFAVVGEFSEQNAQNQFGFLAKRLDLQQLTELAQGVLPLTTQQQRYLKEAQPKGELTDVALFADMKQQSGAIKSGFKALTLLATELQPGFANLSGSITGSDQHGTIRLNTTKALLTAGNLFREPQTIDRLTGLVAWRQTDSAWLLSLNKLLADFPVANTETNGRLSIPKNTLAATVEVKTHFSSTDMSKVPAALPTKVMSETLVNWLDHAFIGGRIPKGDLELRGDMAKFPFITGPGLFKVLFEVEQLGVSFNPNWPVLNDLSGSVLFTKKQMDIHIAQGSSHDLQIKQAEIIIPDLITGSELLVTGQTLGDFGQSLNYLLHSPLKARVVPLLDATLPKGRTTVDFKLNIPLIEHVEPKVDVVAQLNQAKLNVKALDLWVQDINGAVKYDEGGIHSDAIAAKALGQPIQIRLARAAQGTQVNVQGKVEIEELKQQFKLPWWRVASGAMDYQLNLALPDSAAAPLLLQVTSDLSGVALDLPGDLAKNRADQRTLAVSFDLRKKNLLPMKLNYAKKLSAALNFTISQQKIDAGHVLVGSGDADFPKAPGIFVEVNREPLALQDWLNMAAAQGHDNLSDSAIRKISIHSEHAFWQANDLGHFDLQLKPEADYWSGELNSSFAKGKLKIPNARTGTEKSAFTMQSVDLTALAKLSSAGKTSGKALSPDLVPIVSISSAKTFWHEHDLGMLDIEAERIPGGLVFKHLDLFGDDQKLNATGDWKLTATGSETHVHGRLDMPQAGATFKNLGISKDISEASGYADFLLSWPAAPYQFSLADLKGQMTINLNRGRILSIEPGFGRILGVLALAQWVNRLKLDFSDIYQEGLTFNTITGRFDLVNGKAATKNLVVDAIPAKITLTGDTDLVRKTVDQVVNVSPKSADAVPIAGTIMGKITALIAKSLTGKEQEGLFFGSQYLVKGVWGNVQIIPLHENDGLLQKTWNGISTFPWMQQPKK